MPSQESRVADLSKILTAQEAERRRIARELHDEFGQHLTGLKFDLTWLRSNLVQQHRTAHANSLIKKVDTMIVAVDALTASVHNTATSLHPSILDDLGLLPALEWLAGDFQARTNIRCTTVIDPALSDTQMTIETSTALYRIVQELLTNVARHAQASAVNISLFERGGELVLDLADNGKGIDRRQMKQRGALGLRGIRDRVSMLNGTMTIVGEPGHGTTVSLTLACAAMTGHGPVAMHKHSRSHAGISLPNEK